MEKKISWVKLRNSLFNNLILKIGSVLFAVVLWVIVINIDDPSKTVTISNIPVEILNDNVITDNDQVYTVDAGSTISIKITGPRTIVDALKVSDFVASADFYDISQTNAVPIDVELRSNTYESKVTINEKSDNAMRLAIEKVTEIDYEITPEVTGSVAENYTLYKSSLKTENVKIKAPESVHSQIAGVRAAIKLSGSETDDFTYDSEIILYDKNGNVINNLENGISLGTSSVKAECVVYFKKTVPLSFGITNNIGVDSEITIEEQNPEYVTIAGRKEVIDGLSEIAIPSENLVATMNTTEFNIDLTSVMPKGVYLLSNDTNFYLKISYLNTISKSFEFDVNNIAIKNIPDGYGASITNTGSVTITVKGFQDKVDSILKDDLAPFVSLENLSFPGETEVNVQILTIDGITMENPLSLHINLTEKTIETTAETTTEETIETTTEEITTEETTTDISQ